MNKYTHIYIYCKHKCTHTYILIYIYIITYHFHEIAPLYPFVAYFYVFPLSMFDYRWSVRFILLHFGVSRTLLQAPNYRFNQLLKLHIARGDLLRIPEKKNFWGCPNFDISKLHLFLTHLQFKVEHDEIVPRENVAVVAKVSCTQNYPK